jgi:hypothetical protein
MHTDRIRINLCATRTDLIKTHQAPQTGPTASAYVRILLRLITHTLMHTKRSDGQTHCLHSDAFRCICTCHTPRRYAYLRTWTTIEGPTISRTGVGAKIAYVRVHAYNSITPGNTTTIWQSHITALMVAHIYTSSQVRIRGITVNVNMKSHDVTNQIKRSIPLVSHRSVNSKYYMYYVLAARARIPGAHKRRID